MDEILDRNDKRDEKHDYIGSFGNYVAERWVMILCKNQAKFL